MDTQAEVEGCRDINWPAVGDGILLVLFWITEEDGRQILHSPLLFPHRCKHAYTNNSSTRSYGYRCIKRLTAIF